MKRTKFTPTGTLVVQFQSGQSVDVLVEDGVVYAPIMKGLEIAADEEAEEEEPKVKSEKAAPKAEKEEATTSREKLTEKEMMEMDTKELIEIAEEIGADLSGKGKNTNKKVRLAILEAQEGAEESSEEEEAPEEEAEDAPSINLKKLASDMEEGDVDYDEALESLTEGKSKSDKKKITNILDEWYDDEEAEAADLVVLLEPFFNDEEEEEEAPKKKAGKKKAEKKATKKEEEEPEEEEEEVEIEALDVDDDVNVYWSNLKEWFTGTVVKKKGKKVIVKYDADQVEEVLDPKVHTKILLVEGA